MCCHCLRPDVKKGSISHSVINIIVYVWTFVPYCFSYSMLYLIKLQFSIVFAFYCPHIQPPSSVPYLTDCFQGMVLHYFLCWHLFCWNYRANIPSIKLNFMFSFWKKAGLYYLDCLLCTYNNLSPEHIHKYTFKVWSNICNHAKGTNILLILIVTNGICEYVQTNKQTLRLIIIYHPQTILGKAFFHLLYQQFKIFMILFTWRDIAVKNKRKLHLMYDIWHLPDGYCVFLTEEHKYIKTYSIHVF